MIAYVVWSDFNQSNIIGPNFDCHKTQMNDTKVIGR